MPLTELTLSGVICFALIAFSSLIGRSDPIKFKILLKVNNLRRYVKSSASKQIFEYLQESLRDVVMK